DPASLLMTKKDLSLPTHGARGAQLSWTSNKPRYVSNQGLVTRPNVGEGNQTVTLTATINVLGQTMTVSKDVIVAERSTYNRTAYYPFDDDLSDKLMHFADGVASPDVAQSLSATAFYTDGHSGMAVNLDGSYGVLLPADMIDSYQYTVSFWMNQQAANAFRPAFFAAQSVDPARWFSFLPVSW